MDQCPVCKEPDADDASPHLRAAMGCTCTHRQLRARIKELEAVLEGKCLTHTIAIAPGVVVYGNAEAAAAMAQINDTFRKAKDALGL